MMSPQERHLAFGPHWHVLQSTAIGAGEGLAHLALPDHLRSEAQGMILHPGLLDLATGWAMDLIPGYDGAHLWVPMSYGVIRVHRALPADLISHVRRREGDAAGVQTFDIWLCDRAGGVHAEIEGFRITRLEHGFAAAADPAPRELDPEPGAAPLSEAEERLVHAISQGIPPDEGLELLGRALATGQPSLFVSSLHLPDLVAEADRAATPRTEAAAFARPDLDNEFAVPETATQQALARYWEKLLGVSSVGIHDGFFDLGGHSLIAVRLFAMIRKDMGVDFPISVLFEAPTIAGIAALIDARTGGSDAAVAADAPEAAAAPAFRHVVPLHPVTGPPDRPVFIVAGMFGNVLNLRHLSLLLGERRPVYGLQARGLIGGDAPHATIEEAAHDYIAEMRQVQPEGPYLIGGFSGGGITAFEIARQLEIDGQRTAMLALLDTPLPVRPALSRRDKALIKLQEFRRKGPRYAAEWLRARRDWQARQRETAEGGADMGGYNNRAIEAAFRAAVASYAPRRWDGNAVLLRPRLDRHWAVSRGNHVSAEREYVFADNQWGQYAPNLTVIEVPGDHDGMVLMPNVAVLADRLRREIARAEGSAAAPPASVTAAE
jgi:thioesterase domain-containing protein